jgi:predicted AAA+ superfamily ATPase
LLLLRFEHRVAGFDDNRRVLLGARSYDSHEHAYQTLCDFIDGELARRQQNAWHATPSEAP